MTGDVTFNNNVGVKGKNTSGTAREMIVYNASNNLSIGSSVDGIIIMGYGATADDPLYIRVGAADAKQVTASGNDTCGAGFKCLRVPN